MSDEEKGFTVVDKRAFGSGDENDQAAEAETASQEQAAAKEYAADGDRAASAGPGPGDFPPVDFAGFIISMAHAAMHHLGMYPDPVTQQLSEANLPMARHTIDTIAMIREKTQGNLSTDEQKMLDSILADLRMAYVQLRG